MGVSLLKYSDIHPVPVEQSFGGEIGIFYFVPLIASFFKISALDATWFFLLIQVASGCLVAGTAFFSIAKTVLGKIVVVVGMIALSMIVWLVSDVYIVYFFTVSFFPWVIALLEKKHYKVLFIYSFVLGVVIEYGNFVRSFSGLPLLVGFIVATVYFYKISRKTFFLLIPLILGIGCLKLHVYTVIKHRDVYLKNQGYNFEKEQLQHVFWHSVYAGFGFITNNKNINFSDSCSANRVKKINSQAEYLKPLYESTLRNEVLKLCIYSPHYVLRVLFAKLGVLFYYLLLFANIGLIMTLYYPKPLYIEYSYWAMLLISALPGILTIPNTLYLLGFVSVAVLYGIHSIIYALNMRFKIFLQ